MFVELFFISIIIGYLMKGSIKNIDVSNIRGLYLIFIAFFIEFAIIMSIRKGFITIGYITYGMDLVMYILIFLFIYLNRSNIYLVLMGAGFLLNALPIFFNGGAMPVSVEAAVYTGLIQDADSAKLSSYGLYSLIDSNTKLWFLGDIIPRKYPRPIVFSIGDLISAIGLSLFVITSMKKKKVSN
jgi:hypothetical protein